MKNSNSRTAIVAGSTGLVGSQLLQKLLQGEDYGRVIALTRRPLPLSHAKLQTLIADFDDLTPLIPQMQADDAFCCLGTTQAKAGGRAALERVDYHMSVEFARSARKAGAERLFVVSAIGSAPRSLSFYSRTKARMEAAVANIDYRAIQIVQPSLLLGAREESRPAEALGQRVAPLLAPLLIGPLKSYRPIAADAVADALLTLARDQSARGVHVRGLPL